jgi:hypothetical protein
MHQRDFSSGGYQEQIFIHRRFVVCFGRIGEYLGAQVYALLCCFASVSHHIRMDDVLIQADIKRKIHQTEVNRYCFHYCGRDIDWRVLLKKPAQTDRLFPHYLAQYAIRLSYIGLSSIVF